MLFARVWLCPPESRFSIRLLFDLDSPGWRSCLDSNLKIMGARLYLLRPNEPGEERPLTLIVTRGGRRIGVPAGHSVAPQTWLQKSQRVKPDTPGATELNAALQKLRAKAVSLSFDYPDDEDLKNALLEHVGRPRRDAAPRIRDRFEVFLEEKRATVKPSTLQVYEALKKHVYAFVDEPMRTHQIGPAFLRDFQQHMVAKKIENSTVNKYTTRFRGFLSWLKETGSIAEVPTAKSLSTVDDDVVRLDLAELEALRRVDLTNETAGHSHARDIFLFSCFTGLRFGDCRALTWDSVGNDAVFVAESKTNHFRRIPLTSAAREIIDRNRGKRDPLPALSNQKANDLIKKVAALAEIDTPIMKRSRKGGKIVTTPLPKYDALSMHDGRRTFVSLMLESGVSTKELLGVTHSDLRALQRYAAASEAHLRQAMGDIFDATAEAAQ